MSNLLPWTRDDSGDDGKTAIRDATGFAVAVMWHYLTDVHEDNVRRVLRAVNAHDELVAACEGLIADVEQLCKYYGCHAGDVESVRDASAALTKAKGDQ